MTNFNNISTKADKKAVSADDKFQRKGIGML